MAMGVTLDPSYAFPLPILGINYLNFAFHGPDNQLAVLFAGVLAAGNVQRPKMGSTPFDGRIDFVWSYDSFVHMDRNVIGGYLKEIKRVLKIGGTSILHHAGIENLDSHVQSEHPGWRSQMNADAMRQLAEEAGLEVMSQFVYWDEEARIGVPRFGDKITWLARKV